MTKLCGISLEQITGISMGGELIRVWPGTVKHLDDKGITILEASLYDGVDARRMRADGNAGAPEPPKVRFFASAVTAVTW